MAKFTWVPHDQSLKARIKRNKALSASLLLNLGLLVALLISLLTR